MQAFADSHHPASQWEAGNLLIAQAITPFGEPLRSRLVIREGMVDHGHEMGFTLTTFALEGNRASLIGADCLNSLQYIRCRICDLEKIRRRNLRRASLVFVGQLNGGAL